MVRTVIITAALSCVVTSACFLIVLAATKPTGVSSGASSSTAVDRQEPVPVGAGDTNIRRQQVLLDSGRDGLNVYESHGGRVVEINAGASKESGRDDWYVTLEYQKTDDRVKCCTLQIGRQIYIDLDGDGVFDRRCERTSPTGRSPSIWFEGHWEKVDLYLDAGDRASNREKGREYAFSHGVWAVVNQEK
jgi:hypothetical protein